MTHICFNLLKQRNQYHFRVFFKAWNGRRVLTTKQQLSNNKTIQSQVEIGLKNKAFCPTRQIAAIAIILASSVVVADAPLLQLW